MTAENENDNDSAFDSKRRLCPDGSCVGVIGQDGKCSECGRTATGEAPAEDVRATELDADEVDARSTTEGSATATSAGGFDPSRRLCSDESCIGVIGDDGRCKECGKPA